VPLRQQQVQAVLLIEQTPGPQDFCAADLSATPWMDWLTLYHVSWTLLYLLRIAAHLSLLM